MTILQVVKQAIPVTTDAYDEDLTQLIEAAKLDLHVSAGVVLTEPLDALTTRAVITYCKMHFLSMGDSEYARFKAAYDEQKAQLMTATGYTEWSTEHADA